MQHLPNDLVSVTYVHHGVAAEGQQEGLHLVHSEGDFGSKDEHLTQVKTTNRSRPNCIDVKFDVK